MAMNLLHQRRCSSVGWADMVRDELLPWALADVELGDQTLEIGPGYGATLRALLERADAVTAVEVDKPMAERLDRLYGDRARVIHGDGSNTGLPDTSFASVVCFTMLHHVPTVRLQDQLFAEAFRVLRPGGVHRHSHGRGGRPTALAGKQTRLGGTPVSLTPNLIREYPGEPTRRERGRSCAGTPR